MFCLFCKKKNSIFRRLIDSRSSFCSRGHETAYDSEIKGLMLARLMESGATYATAQDKKDRTMAVMPPKLSLAAPPLAAGRQTALIGPVAADKLIAPPKAEAA